MASDRLLGSLKDSILVKPPYISGTLHLPSSYFSLYYKVAGDGHAARHINLANATPDELEQLVRACDPTSGTMDSECFSSTLNVSHTDMVKIVRECLLEGIDSTNAIKIKLHKLNACGRSSFVEPQINTLQRETTFGLLVVVFPTPHEGGALVLREDGHEWILDSGQALASAAEGQPSIGYTAFYSDVDHIEVAPVTSGHRISLTYNLYFDNGGPAFASDTISRRLTRPQVGNEGTFHEAFTALLENPEFLADGGALAFGLRHIYPIKEDLTSVYSILKGSDSVVYQTVRALGYEPQLCVYYGIDPPHGVVANNVVDFEAVQCDSGLVDTACQGGGSRVGPEGYLGPPYHAATVPMEWVTPMTRFNEQKDAYPTYDEEDEGITVSMEWVYGNVCLVVRIGKAGERLEYRTVADLIKARRWGQN